MQRLVTVAVVLLLASPALADVYLHNPHGSNDRLNDNNRDRDNGNRLFDSQDNNRGGYNVGNLYYYARSVLPIEWTNQHSCANPNNDCQIIIQAMCDSQLRDGTVTTRIPDDPRQCKNWNCDTDVKFGRHESLASYMSCMYRERNKGLFNANQNLQGNGAIYTRQNPNGDRHGYECTEERDYYPYWAPSGWADIAILTNNPQRCAEYIASSENTVGRCYCVPPAGWLADMVSKNAEGFVPITQQKCELLTYKDTTDGITRQGVWNCTQPNGWPAPACREPQWTRDNHLGNVEGGYPQVYNFTIPDAMIADNCVIRMRYNISSADLGPDVDSSQWLNMTSVQSSAYLNGSLSVRAGNTNTQPAKANVWSKYGLTYSDVAESFNPQTQNNPTNSREYVWKNDPEVDIFGSLLPGLVGGTRLKVELAINTNQFGRTFEDRSHRLSVKSPQGQPFDGQKIHNLNVNGKRGNIVQVFPSTEYDFMPRRLVAAPNDWVHFQWTGSNTNPNNNAGQGLQGSDRSNAVILGNSVYLKEGYTPAAGTIGDSFRSYPGNVNAAAGFLGMSSFIQKKLAVLATNGNNIGQYSGQDSQMDDAGAYFDLTPQQITVQNGVYNYMCTRNHDFTNRDQKGVVVVTQTDAQTEALGWAGGSISTNSGSTISADQGDLQLLTIITIEDYPPGSSDTFGQSASDFVVVQPDQLNCAPGQSLTLSIPYTRNAVGRTTLYWSPTRNGAYGAYDADFSGGVASAQICQGGWYVVQTQTNWAGVVGVTLAVSLVIAGGSYFLWRHMKNKKLAANSGGIQRATAGRV